MGQKPDFEDDDDCWGQAQLLAREASTWELDARPELWRKFVIIEVALVGLDSMTTLITLYIDVYNWIMDAFDDPLLACWV